MKLALLSTKIFTGEDNRPWAEALAVDNGRIVKVGTNEEITDFCTADFERIELPGRLIVPGLVDGHLHFLKYGQSFTMVDLQKVASIEACRERVRVAVSQARPGDWIVGWGWNHHIWEEGREPHKTDLDDIAPENPVILSRMCGHSAWVNSRALEIAGIDRNTPNPPGGRYEHDPVTGDLTGVVREKAEAIKDCIPEPTSEDLKNMALTAQREAFRRGITGVHTLESLNEFKVWKNLDEQGLLKIRIHHTLPPAQLPEALAMGLKPALGSDRLWFGGVKMFTDGSLGSGTALMFEEYSDEPGNFGIEFTPLSELKDCMLTAYEHGCDAAIHAIGDRGIHTALETYAAGRAKYPGDHRDRVEHCQCFRDEDLDRIAEMGLVASVQPVHLTTDWAIADKRWGGSRCPKAYAYNSLLKNGVKVQFGSDAPVEPADPLLSIRAAVLRQDLAGRPEGGWYPEERMALDDCLKAFSSTPAWVSRKENDLGTITEGKLADLTILAGDLFELPPDEWLSVQVDMTVVGGEIVYRRGEDD